MDRIRLDFIGTVLFGPQMGIPAIGPIPASILAIAAAIIIIPGALISERKASADS